MHLDRIGCFTHHQEHALPELDELVVGVFEGGREFADEGVEVGTAFLCIGFLDDSQKLLLLLFCDFL